MIRIHPNEPYRKKKIPRALREALWIKYYPNRFSGKCQTSWCPNRITAFDFQAGHDVPESKGGITSIENLIPICSRCNLSMGSQYTFIQWSTTFNKPRSIFGRLFNCLTRVWPRFLSRFFSCLTKPLSQFEVVVANLSTPVGPSSDMPPASSSPSSDAPPPLPPRSRN